MTRKINPKQLGGIITSIVAVCGLGFVGFITDAQGGFPYQVGKCTIQNLPIDPLEVNVAGSKNFRTTIIEKELFNCSLLDGSILREITTIIRFDEKRSNGNLIGDFKFEQILCDKGVNLGAQIFLCETKPIPVVKTPLDIVNCPRINAWIEMDSDDIFWQKTNGKFIFKDKTVIVEKTLYDCTAIDSTVVEVFNIHESFNGGPWTTESFACLKATVSDEPDNFPTGVVVSCQSFPPAVEV